MATQNDSNLAGSRNVFVLFSESIKRSLVNLKATAGWRDFKLVTLCTSTLGLVGDFLTPVFDILANGLFVSMLTWIFGIVILKFSARKKFSSTIERFSARFVISSMMATIIFGAIFFVNLLLEDECEAGVVSCTITPAAYLQANLFREQLNGIQAEVEIIRENSDQTVALTETISDVLQATQDDLVLSNIFQEESNTIGGEIRDAVQENLANVDSIDSRMEYSDAREILDRSLSEMMTSMQGQDRAIEALLALGFEFNDVDYTGLTIRNAEIPRIDFSGAILKGVDFSGAIITEALMSNASMEFANLDQVSANGVDLSGAYLPYASAEQANFNGANLSRFNGFSMRLRGADLKNANLSGASLVMADLRDVDLSGADLSNAVLFGAVLTGANLEGAIFNNTDIGSAVGIDTAEPLGAPLVCARNTEGDFGYMDVHIIEVIPSSRFSSGFAYEPMETYSLNPVIPVGSQQFNELCEEVDESEFVRRNPPIFGGRISSDHIRFQLPTELLGSSNRRRTYLERISFHQQFLNDEIREELFFQ